MSLRTSLFLALRYLKPRISFTTVSTALSVLGPIIGVAVLVVVISVMNGFHEEIRSRFFGLSAHIFVDYWGRPIDNHDQLVDELEEMGLEASPVISTPSLIQLPNQKRIVYHMFNGIDPKTDRDVTEIREKCYVEREVPVYDNSGRQLDTETRIGDFRDEYDKLKDGEVICGISFLTNNGLKVGDKIVVHPISKLESLIEYKEDGSIEMREMDDAYVPVELKIVGTFSFDMSRFDSDVSMISLDQAADLAGLDWGQAQQIRIKTPDPFLYESYIEQISSSEAFETARVWSWRQENRSFFNALQTEKTTMFVLLVLIVIVSAFCVAATLITIVLQKTHEIGILKALGAAPQTIMSVFFIQGAVIGALGTILGTVLGLIMLQYRNGFLQMMSKLFGLNLLPPELYFFQSLPAKLQWPDILVVDLCTFIICVLAGVFPAIMAMLIQPGRAIKAE